MKVKQRCILCGAKYLVESSKLDDPLYSLCVKCRRQARRPVKIVSHKPGPKR